MPNNFSDPRKQNPKQPHVKIQWNEYWLKVLPSYIECSTLFWMAHLCFHPPPFFFFFEFPCCLIIPFSMLLYFATISQTHLRNRHWAQECSVNRGFARSETWAPSQALCGLLNISGCNSEPGAWNNPWAPAGCSSQKKKEKKKNQTQEAVMPSASHWGLCTHSWPLLLSFSVWVTFQKDLAEWECEAPGIVPQE